jgi:hypothetical protein
VAGSCEYGDEPSGSGATELGILPQLICNLVHTIHLKYFYEYQMAYCKAVRR